MEGRALACMERIDSMGGMIPAVEHNYRKMIANASYDYQRRIESGEQVIVGVNRFTQEEEQKLKVLRSIQR